MTPAQLEAAKVLGGCEHTPNPFQACDTCGRQPIAGRHDKTVAYNFMAETVDGAVFVKKDVLSVSNLPLDRISKLTVLTDDPRNPRVTLVVDPRNDERLFQFSRHAVRTGAPGPAKSSLTVTVFEILFLNSDRFVRLYLHPLQGPILSTQDLYF